jgi:hypothetical protein
MMPVGEHSSKVVAVVQSNYIPWRGYFDLIRLADEFVLFDDVQYTRRDWRNRNQIKTAQGLKWLTIPVDVKGKYHQKIKETRVADPRWAAEHWETIRHAYGKAAGFSEKGPLLEELYLGCQETMLSMVNYRFLTGICRMLDIQANFSWSSDYQLADDKSERLLSICTQAGATHYLSGPSAKSYLDVELLRQGGVEVIWMDYSGYADYRQLHPPFEPHVSIIDLLLNEGVNAREFVGTPADV